MAKSASMSRRILTLLTAALLAVVVAWTLAQPVTAADLAALPPTPSEDPFYGQPNPFPDVAPGTILDSRPMTIRALAVPVPIQAWQVKYASTDTHGKQIADVATIMRPVNPKPEGKGTLVSYQTAQDGLTTDCAPSYSLATGVKVTSVELATMTPLLAAGHTVVTADYEGPES